MRETTLFEIIKESARQVLELQNADGSMPPGHNGPYNDLETPVRNTGHWLMVFKKAFDISGEEKFKEATHRCLKYLMSDKARPMAATFWHRYKPQKDFTNGIIGQAWTIEALLDAYQLFKDQKILNQAKEVYCLHPYDKEAHGWKIVNVDGSIRGFDFTYNHQLWFAAIGAKLMHALNETDLNGVMSFINNISKNMQLYKNGVIKHIPPLYLRKGGLDRLKGIASMVRSSLRGSNYIYSKSVGYHGFNLYALALIHEVLPHQTIFEESKLKKAVQVSKGDTFRKELNISKYGYPYNPAGIELSFVFDVLGDIEQRDFWISEQIQKTFDFSQNLMVSGGTFDTNTAAARLYEAVRIRDCKVLID